MWLPKESKLNRKFESSNQGLKCIEIRYYVIRILGEGGVEVMPNNLFFFVFRRS